MLKGEKEVFHDRNTTTFLFNSFYVEWVEAVYRFLGWSSKLDHDLRHRVHVPVP